MPNPSGAIGGGTFTLQTARHGLRTAPGASGQPEQDGLHRADNTTINREGLLEPRRGLDDYATFPGETLDRLGLFRGSLVSHSAAGTLRLHDTGAGTSRALSAIFPTPSLGRVRLAEQARCLFVRHGDGISRVDTLAGEAKPAGVPGGLDCDASITTTAHADGTAIPGDCQVAYRTAFGTYDDNGRLILGAPSGRAVAVSAAYEVLIGSASRSVATGTATVTVSNLPTTHGLVINERIEWSGTDPGIPNGVYEVASTGANYITFTYATAATGTVVNTVGCLLARTARNLTVNAAIPQGASTPGFVARFYRSVESVSCDAPPGDDMGLVAEVAVPQVAQVTNLQRTANTVTATTQAAHGWTPGGYVRIIGLAGASGQDVRVGTAGGADRSADQGVTWGNNALAGAWRALAWSSPLSLFAAAGDNVLATSPTGVTWTARTIPAPLAGRSFRAMAQGNGWFMALSPGSGTDQRGGSTPTLVSDENPATPTLSDWLTLGGVQPGAAVSLRSTYWTTTVSEGSWVPATTPRTITYTSEYRINGGAWTALSSATKSATSTHQTTTAALGTPPATDGTLDVRVRVSVPGVAVHQAYDSGEGVWFDVYDYGHASIDQPTCTGLAPKAMRSSDGTTWTEVTLPAGAWDTLTHDGSRFVLVGHGAGTTPDPLLQSASSSDGSSWSTGSVSAVVGRAYGAAGDGAGNTVVVGLGLLAWSATGVSWNAGGTPTGPFLAIAKGPGGFVAVGPACAINTATGNGFAAGTLASTMYAITFDGARAVAVGDLGAYTSDDLGLTWTLRGAASGTWRAVAASPATGITGGAYQVLTTPTGTSFTFSTVASGTVASTGVSQAAVPLTVGITDASPASVLSEAAYWNQTQDGILSSHDLPPDALDLAVFGDRMLYAAPQRAAVILAGLLKVGTGGVQAGDYVQLPGIKATAGASEAWDANAPTFKVYSDSTDQAVNLYRTAASLVRVINRANGSVVAIQTSDSSSPSPGGFAILGTDWRQTISVSFYAANGGVWSPAGGKTQAPTRDLNAVAYSLPGMPDSVPMSSYDVVGDANKAILRLIPLRESCLVLKEDGVFRLRGVGPYTVEPVDRTLRLVGPETACFVSNNCLCLTNQGVVAIGESGVQQLSADVEDKTNEALTPSRRAATNSLAFGVAYEYDATYTLWLPSSDGASAADWALVYHVDKEEWTARTDARTHAIVTPGDDRLWAVQGATLYRERKALDYTDHVDHTRATPLFTSQTGDTVVLSSVSGVQAGDVLTQGDAYAVVLSVPKGTSSVKLDRATASFSFGPVTVLAGITTDVEWRARYMPQAGHRLMRAREVALSFRDLHLAGGSVAFSSDLASTTPSVPLSGALLAVPTDASKEQERVVRVLVPRDCIRCTRLNVRWRHYSGYQPFMLDGMAVTYSIGGERVPR